MKLPYAATVSSLVLGMALAMPASAAPGEKFDYTTQNGPTAWPNEYAEPAPGQNFDYHTQISDIAVSTLKSQWLDPKPDTGAHDIFEKEYQPGYRNYLDAYLPNNPLPTPISEGTYQEAYVWVDGYRYPRD
ncbi:hypothetical protein Thimo_3547 [Thioflavicoccus mobilis 8321]|uniref:Uncharacterized protein n=1 Tax=Thioflavicoccus mobilis 8321 TaxID=765912 RepID=L0H3N6_9GAMM|nr:hypothetical protein [Thioflavicoccus mobilis]AGA92204.1 hypothetical protein Thimo_3547 [Thioflavicoccus mobilis 8321]